MAKKRSTHKKTTHRRKRSGLGSPKRRHHRRRHSSAFFGSPETDSFLKLALGAGAGMFASAIATEHLIPPGTGEMIVGLGKVAAGFGIDKIGNGQSSPLIRGFALGVAIDGEHDVLFSFGVLQAPKDEELFVKVGDHMDGEQPSVMQGEQPSVMQGEQPGVISGESFLNEAFLNESEMGEGFLNAEMGNEFLTGEVAEFSELFEDENF